MHSVRAIAAKVAMAMLAAVGSGIASGCAHQQSAVDVQRALTHASTGVVAVATSHDGEGSVTLCSGTVVAPNLVLTARHCVSNAITTMPSCDADGRSHNGAHLGDDADPSHIAIYVGDHVQIDRDVPQAHATKTLHPVGHVLCDADVAYIVLDKPLTGVAILPLKLRATVETGEEIVPVGFGGGTDNVIGERRSRPRSTVLAVGPTADDATGAVLGPREFEVDTATCRGDSGGPAIDIRTGEVVGVVSRGGSCVARGNHVYTRVDAYTRLSSLAFSAAEREARANYALLQQQK